MDHQQLLLDIDPPIDKTKLLFVNLSEELSEATVEALKCVRYTPNPRDSFSKPGKIIHHSMKLAVEMHQAIGLFNLLVEMGAIPQLPQEQIDQIRDEKIRRTIASMGRYQ